MKSIGPQLESAASEADKPDRVVLERTISLATWMVVASLLLPLSGCQNPGDRDEALDDDPQESEAQGADPTTVVSNRTVSTMSETLLVAFDETIDFAAIDDDKLHRAILLETNRARAAEGLPPLSSNPRLALAAKHHARDMVEFDFFDHESPVDGRKSLLDRCRAVGMESGSFGENIATQFGISLGSGEPFLAPSAERPFFARAGNSEPIPQRSYAELARAVVLAWMDSPGHRANILGTSWTQLGCAGDFYHDRSSHDMPKVKLVQVFGSLEAPAN
jgi:uncharacterized protein YkwD